MMKISVFIFFCLFAENNSSSLDREIKDVSVAEKGNSLLWLFTKQLDRLENRQMQLQNIVNDNVAKMAVFDKANKEVLAELHMLKNGIRDYHMNVSKALSELQKEYKTFVKKGECEAGWQHFRDHCYYFSVEKRQWLDAKNVCVFKKGYLVKVNDGNENNWLKSKVIQHTWIGANDRQVEGHWKWVNDNTHLSFSDWYPGNPSNHGNNEHCAHLYSGVSFQWNDVDCSSIFHYICERRQGQ